MKMTPVYIILSILLLACSEKDISPITVQTPIDLMQLTESENDKNLAAITAVSVSGDAMNYNFSVTILSPDTGCDQYADWWEVFKPDGTLVYRRVLLHSHVSEQPFTRSGGSVAINADEEVIVRAHMNNLGYGTQVMRGTVTDGFTIEALDASYAAELETVEPLPTDCAF